MLTNYSLTLTWPTAGLFPNKKSHWAKKADEVLKYRSDCYYLTKHQIKAFKWHGGFIPLNIVFHAPNNRHDLDGCLSALKAGLDGVAEALKVNDKFFRGIAIDFGEVKKGGEVIVQLLA